MSDYITTAVIDPLGAETEEQKTERKTSPEMQRFNRLLLIAVFLLGALVFWAIGVWMGATDPMLWNYVPGVEEPPTVYVEVVPEEG